LQGPVVGLLLLLTGLMPLALYRTVMWYQLQRGRTARMNELTNKKFTRWQEYREQVGEGDNHTDVPM